MRYALPLIALIAAWLAGGSASAAPAPAVDVPAMIAAADVVVVGRVEGVRVFGTAPTQTFSLTIGRVLKGSVAPRRQISVRLDLSAAGASSVVERQYGVLFLRRDGAVFAAVDASRPVLPASPGHTLVERAVGPLRAVAAELGAVLATPAATLLDPVEGVGSRVIGTAAARADETYYEAAEALATLPYAAAGAALRQLAATGPQAARTWALVTLFRMDGPEQLRTARLALLNDIAPSLAKVAGSSLAIDSLARALDRGDAAADAVPALAALLKSRSVELRRTAAALLGDIGTEAVVAPLGAVALEDPDQEVRYQAVIGLAAATGRGEAPALAKYRASESRYLTSWRAFARTLKR